MVDVLLAQSYFLVHDPKQLERMRPYPPLATLYAAQSLRNAGHVVAVFDAMLSSGEHEFVSALEEHGPRVVLIAEDNFNYLSKMCLARTRAAALTMVAAAAERGCHVVVGGSDVSDDPAVFFAAGACAAMIGEYEHTAVEVVHHLAAHGPATDASAVGAALAQVPGLALPPSLETAPEIVRTPRRPNERHPDSFGIPARDLIDHERYRTAWRGRHGYFSINMVSTRGCPFHCNWCAKPIWGQRYAMRSPAAVAEELATVKATIAPDHVWFADDIFGLRPSWLTEFADRVDALGASIPFTIQSRCDLMTPQAVAALRRAGCATVWLGAESGSQRILDAMDKGTTVSQIRSAREGLGAAGIEACFFIQLGYPGERWDDLEATIALVRDLQPDDIGVSVSYPLPGTRFHTMVADQLGTKTHWDDSGDLAMMFRGTYTSAFYRHLHRLLHLELDVTRGTAGAEALVEPWHELRRLEQTCRSERPTLIVKAEATPPAPDLAEAYG